MKFTYLIMPLLIIALTGCKKENQPADPNNNGQVKKDTVFLLTKMVTTELLTPSPVTKTETFDYNTALQLTKHTVIYKSASSNFTVDFTPSYDDEGKVAEVVKTGTKYYPWNKLTFTYSGDLVTTVYSYPEAEDETLHTTINTQGQVEKVVGREQQYQFTHDDKGNIIKRGLYDNDNPTEPNAVIDFGYDDKNSHLSGFGRNIYILHQAFNDVFSAVNNRKSNNNLEFYNYTYNDADYPTQMVVSHSGVAVRKVDYSYKIVITEKN